MGPGFAAGGMRPRAGNAGCDLRYSHGSRWVIPRAMHRILESTRMNHGLTTTAFSLDGYRTVRTLGVVRGIIVRSRSIVGNIGAGFQTLFGGNISLYTSLCERTRSEAFELMLSHAQQLGGNAVIGIRYDATEVMAGVTEVLCYGTAVVVERAGGT